MTPQDKAQKESLDQTIERLADAEMDFRVPVIIDKIDETLQRIESRIG